MPSLPGQASFIKKTSASLGKEAGFLDAADVSLISRATTFFSNAVPGSPTAGAPTSPMSLRFATTAGLLSQSTSSFSNRDTEEVGKQARAERRKRNGDLRAMPTLGDVMDDAVENAAEELEQHWLLKSCVDQPVCQRVCYPAHYATRHQKAKTTNDAVAVSTGGNHDEVNDKHKNYGFPDFGATGFTVVPNDEVSWVDKLVPERLGLAFATHRKTSVKRFAYVVDKGKLPTTTTPQEITILMRNLKRCDHLNILQVNEVFEDEDALYIMYEHFPCCTLLSQLESHTWSQSQIVNIIRECCAATAYCASSGLRHIGWTLCHILLPAKAANGGDPGFGKVFGFGLMGPLLVDTFDHLLWGPEALEKYKQQNGVLGNFLLRLEGHLMASCDSWSLGAIIYSLIARRPPAALEEDILEKRWNFTLAIDDVDPEAKTLVEGFLHSNSDRRMRPERALHHEWVRRRWRSLPGGDKVFLLLENFCHQPIAKRLFARFLTFYLDAEHFLKIAESFHRLDLMGNGMITVKELEIAAKSAGRPTQAAHPVHHWLSRDGAEHITLLAFAEAFAESVIDGKALRHAFESLDDDGSQQISAEELFGALRGFDSTLTIENIIDHIDSAELDVGEDDSAQDHAIDYSEFVRLFPECVRRTEVLKERLHSSRESGDKLSQRFRSQQPDMEEWADGLENLSGVIHKLSIATIQRGDRASEAAIDLRKHFAHVEHGLRCPPGPETEATKAQQRGQGFNTQKKAALKANGEGYGFDTFVQDLALEDQWYGMISMESKMLKSAVNIHTRKFAGQSDQLKAHDAAEGVQRKLNDALRRVKGQFEEYLSFTETIESPEPVMNDVAFSGRALPPRSGDADEDDLFLQAGDRDDNNTRNPIARFLQEVTARFTAR